ncbi:MAG: hypothetical protein EOP08_05745 [Proteobacteria bacterium]|nr:MAG: hypothetical protein EOP08_05745 [Pseudomonadota bacterium]
MPTAGRTASRRLGFCLGIAVGAAALSALGSCADDAGEALLPAEDDASVRPAPTPPNVPTPEADAAARDAAAEAAVPTDAAEADADASSPVMQALLAVLDVKPYVEGTCEPTTYPGWDHPAHRCRYDGGGVDGGLTVTVANPPAARVAAWIIDSAGEIGALEAIKYRDPEQWIAGLVIVAGNVIGQSTRIFPLEGQVAEDIVYRFEKGVTRTCGTGCYCRVNSTSRQHWCSYAAAFLGASEQECLTTYSTTRFTQAWANHCLENHSSSWDRDVNPHFHARAYAAHRLLEARFPDPTTAPIADMMAALLEIFPRH